MFTNTAVAIGRRFRDMVEFEIFAETSPEAFDGAEHINKYHNSAFKRNRVLRNKIAECDLEGKDWSKSDMASIGAALIDIYERTTLPAMRLQIMKLLEQIDTLIEGQYYDRTG